MNSTAEQILDSFEHLTEEEKHRVAIRVFRWWRDAEVTPLSDGELVQVADAIFLGYDEAESDE